MPRATYLDWNATAPLRPEAAAAMTAMLGHCGNPSSVHRWGRAARRTIEDARETLAASLGAPTAGVVFTSGGTEANHLAIYGSGRERILVSAVEHPSVLHAAAAERIPVDGLGVVDLDALDRLLAADPRPAVVSVMLANNETGVLQPIAEISAITRRYGAALHCDAVQAVGRMPVDIGALGVDLMTVSAHKIGGPPGIGALILTGDLELSPQLRGGGQERGRRAGTENTPAILGFAAAATAASTEIAVYDRVAALREALEAEIGAVAPDAVVIGRETPRLPNTTALAMPGTPAETQVIALDLDGVMVSAGAACSAGKVGPSHVLEAMRLPPELAASTIRISLGWDTSEADVAHFLEAWTRLYRRRRNRTGATTLGAWAA
jgi:cysteine desulfurase